MHEEVAGGAVLVQNFCDKFQFEVGPNCTNRDSVSYQTILNKVGQVLPF